MNDVCILIVCYDLLTNHSLIVDWRWYWFLYCC